MMMLERSVYQPTQWTVANGSHLSDIHLVLMSEEADFKSGFWLIELTPGGIIWDIFTKEPNIKPGSSLS